MRLVAIEIEGFRNLATALITPHPKLNVLHGANAQGKTNFLEAIYLLGTLRSFRAARSDELIGFGKHRARVEARVERGGLERRYQVELRGEPSTKRARVDGKGVRSAAEYFGGFNVVLFAPEDLRLVRGAPGERRRFLDRAVWNAQPSFLAAAQGYERVLRSRNALLRGEVRREHADLLDVYDEQLAGAGAELILRRCGYLSALAPTAERAFERITRSGLPLVLRYVSCVGEVATRARADIERNLGELLKASRRRDRERGFTGVGPHQDDLELELGGHPARLHASQGQTRALVLALKIGEIEHLVEVIGESPVLLLDDVSSELDTERSRHLLEFVGQLEAQTYLTTTMPHVLPLPENRHEYQLIDGVVQG